MLLIGGKNLVPLVSAAIIQSLGWRWVFIIVAIIVAVIFVLTFFCVPETCWDRTPLTSDHLHRRESRTSIQVEKGGPPSSTDEHKFASDTTDESTTPIPSPRIVRFASTERPALATVVTEQGQTRRSQSESMIPYTARLFGQLLNLPANEPELEAGPKSPPRASLIRSNSFHSLSRPRSSHSLHRLEKQEFAFQVPPQDLEVVPSPSRSTTAPDSPSDQIEYRFKKKTYREMLTVYQGRLSRQKWWKAALRPFILYCYPSIAFVFPHLMFLM
jgi:hypothetical protein